MKQRTKFKLGVGTFGLLVGPFLAAGAGDVVALALMPKWPIAGDHSLPLALYLLGCIFSGPAMFAALARSREAVWIWVAISIAIVLFLVPVALAFVVPRGSGSIAFHMWAIAFAELTVAWAVAFAGRWVFLQIAPAEAEGG